MNSTNSDQKNKLATRYFLEVYILPLFFGLAICGIVYLITTHYELKRMDRVFGYFMGATAGYALYIRSRSRWLHLINGYYIRKKDLVDDANESTPGKQPYFNEPAHYIATFDNSRFSKITPLIAGPVLVATGIFLFTKSSVFFPVLVITGGTFVSWSGYKEITGTLPQLKLAKEGLWTKQLGFRPWTAIRKTAITEEKIPGHSTIYLDIYLKQTDKDYPDHRLRINDIPDRDRIKMMIDELSGNNPR